MAELKKAVNKMEEQGIPRAVLSEGILTIDVDSHVETCLLYTSPSPRD